MIRVTEKIKVLIDKLTATTLTISSFCQVPHLHLFYNESLFIMLRSKFDPFLKIVYPYDS